MPGSRDEADFERSATFSTPAGPGGGQTLRRSARQVDHARHCLLFELNGSVGTTVTC